MTVLICTRNRPDALGRCLRALAAGRRAPSEIVVVDQGDDDRSRAALQALEAPGVRLTYARRPPTGLGAAQNHGSSIALGDVIAITDDDCLPAADWLERICEALDHAEDVAAVTGPVLPLPAEGERTEAVATRASGVARVLAEGALPWEAGSGNNFAVRRAWFAGVGGCDERLGPGAPGRGAVDMDLFYRLLRAGGRIVYDPGCVVGHERQTRRGRMERRFPYGYGMGVCTVLRLAEGDRHALRVLAAWLRMRVRRLLRGLRRRDGTRVHEELRVLAGTLLGLLYPLRRGLARRARALRGGAA